MRGETSEYDVIGRRRLANHLFAASGVNCSEPHYRESVVEFQLSF